MDTYCHIEEFGENRYNLLPIMAYCFRHSIIWAPNMSKLDRAYRLGKSFFSPEDVLELIEQCHIQVIARENGMIKLSVCGQTPFNLQTGWTGSTPDYGIMR